MGRDFGGDWGLLASSALRHLGASSSLPVAFELHEACEGRRLDMKQVTASGWGQKPVSVVGRPPRDGLSGHFWFLLGTLTVQGNHTQNAASVLIIQIGGANQDGLLAISGSGALAGTSEVSLLGCFVPPSALGSRS
jgi:hypothetical protein